jgi:hypothetical protein
MKGFAAKRVEREGKGLTWPHVSVNTLVPTGRIVVPPSSPVWK